MADIEAIESSKSSPAASENVNSAAQKNTDKKTTNLNDAQSDSFSLSSENKGDDSGYFFDDSFNPQNATKPDDTSQKNPEDVFLQKAEKAREIVQRRLVSPLNNAQVQVKEKTTGILAGFLEMTDKLTSPIKNAAEQLIRNAILNPLSALQTGLQATNADFLARTTNISDKIAAVIGEREKDIREKLSSTVIKAEGQVYDMMAKIDASFEQKDHHKEKKTRDDERRKHESSGRIDNKLA